MSRLIIETTTLLLPDFWSVALFYGDYSGMDDREELELNQWLTNNPEFKTPPVSASDTPEFTPFHDAEGVLPCDCLTYVWRIER